MDSQDDESIFFTNDGFEIPRTTGVGIECISPNSGKKTYKPDVDISAKPVEGMMFDSLDQAWEFYKNYAKLGGFTVRKSSTYEHSGVVKSKYFVCSKEGHKKNMSTDCSESSKKGGRRRPSKRVGCPAKIVLHLSEDNNRYGVYIFVENHNHSFVDIPDYHLLTSSRNLSYLQENLIAKFSTLNYGPVKAFNIMRVICGGFEDVGVTAVDCKNFRRDLNNFIGEFDADLIVTRLRRKQEYSPGFSVEYCTGLGDCLSGLLWADQEMKQYYQLFGEIISFDATFHTNRYDMVFVPFTGIDNHYRNVTLAGSLLASETTESYKWLLQSFKKIFVEDPRVIVTDQDPAMKIAIREVFPSSRHRLCMWHIMKKLSSKVGTKLCNDKTFKRRLCNIVWTDSIEPVDFERLWVEIIKDYNLGANEWLKTMFGMRDDWIPAFYRYEHMSGLMRTTSRSESENHFFGQFSNVKLSLVEFYTHFETAIESQRHTYRKNNHDSRYTQPDFITNYELERQAVEIYTRNLFYDVQEEIFSAVNLCMSVETKDVEDRLKFCIKEIDFAQSVIHEVFLKVLDLEITCSCNRYQQYGLLCRHIFYVLRVCGITVFPQKYIMRRWTKDVSFLKTSSTDLGSSSTHIEDVDKVVREVMILNDFLVNELVKNLDELVLYRDELKVKVSNIDSSKSANPTVDKNLRFSNIVGVEKPSSVRIHAPTGIRNKGTGSHKRFKSLQELASVKAVKQKRACLVCGKSGHNSRTCGKRKHVDPTADVMPSEDGNTMDDGMAADDENSE